MSQRRVRMRKNVFTVLLAAILIVACSFIAGSAGVPTILNIRANIDGRSQLIITGDRLYWRHLDFDAPGRWELGEGSQPTYLNRGAWEPSWPDIPDPTNEYCNCNSSIYRGIPTLARTNQRVWLDLVRARGRIAVVQQPNADNDYTFILELDDDSYGGAEWYEINLSYIVGGPETRPISTITPVFIEPPAPTEVASISGRILSETSDLFLRVYAREVNTGRVYWVNPGEGNLTYTIPDLPPGTYVVVGWFHPMGVSGAYTSLNTVVAEPEDQQQACKEAMIEIELGPGDEYIGADIGCWGGDFFGFTE
jgi:hypothetical protein